MSQLEQDAMKISLCVLTVSSFRSPLSDLRHAIVTIYLVCTLEAIF